MDRTAEIHGEHVGAQAQRALPGVEVNGATRTGASLLRTRCLSRDAGHESPAHGQVQEVRLGMKILVLFDLARPSDPEATFSAQSLKQEDKPTEGDVLGCLNRLGHEVETLAVFDNVSSIVEKVKACTPDVVFNLTESFYHDRAHEPNIPALLELMKVRYTGSGPDALMLCKDKAITKKILAYHHVRVPGFLVSHRQSPLRRLKRFKFPAFVKPRYEESSDGISKASFARDEGEAIERAQFIHQKFDCDALIEEYIEGRELYVSILANRRLG